MLRKYFNRNLSPDNNTGGGTDDNLDNPDNNSSKVEGDLDDPEDPNSGNPDNPDNPDNPNEPEDEKGDENKEGDEETDNETLEVLTEAFEELEALGLTKEEIFAEGVTFGEGATAVAQFAKRVAEVTVEKEVTAAANEFFEENPEIRELYIAKKQGREAEYFKLKAEGAELPTLVDEKDTDQHHKIIKDYYISQGRSIESAERLAKQSIAAETSAEDAKEIVEIRNKQIAEQVKAKEEAAKAEEAKRIADRDAQMAIEEKLVKTGIIGGIKIPVGEQEAFNNFRLRASGDKEYPNASLKQIKLANLTTEEKIMLDLFLFKMDKGKIDLSKLVVADKKTAGVGLKSRLGGAGKSGNTSNKATSSTEFEEEKLD